LLPLIERAHENASHTHRQDAPGRLDRSQGDGRQYELIDNAAAGCDDALATEDYEQAAELRDRIKKLEAP